MNTPVENPPEVKPTITEADVIAFLAKQLVRLKAQSSGYAVVKVELAQWSQSSKPECWFSVNAKTLTTVYSGGSFDEAFKAASAETPDAIADKKRRQAAELLAEADAISPVKALCTREAV